MTRWRPSALSRRCALLLALCAAPAASPARAAPEPAIADPRSQAAAAFREGEAAFRRFDYEAALARYQRSYALAPHPNTLYNVAVTLERLLRYDDAIAALQRYLEAPPVEDRDARRLRGLAERSLQRLRALPARITVSTSPPGATVTLRAADAGAAPIPPARAPATFTLRAGRYQAQLQLPGYESEGETLTVGVGQALLLQRDLRVRPRALSVLSRPPARLFLDDRALGSTPLTLPVPPGDHRLRLEDPLHVTHAAALRFQPGEAPVQYQVTLVRSGNYELLLAATLAGAALGLVTLRALNPDLQIENVQSSDLWRPLVAAPVGAGLGLAAAALVGRSNMPAPRAQLLIGSVAWGALLGMGIGLTYSPQDLTPHMFAVAGGLTGGLTALGVGAAVPLNSGRAALYNSGALWGTTLGALAWAYLAIATPAAGFFGVPAVPRRVQSDGQPGFIAGGCVYGDAPPDIPANTGGRCRSGGVPLMVGTALGVATGITLAALRGLQGLSRARVALIDLGGFTGGLALGLSGLGIGWAAGGREVGLRAGVLGAMGGAGLGLLTGALLTRRVRGAQPEPGMTPGLGRLSEVAARPRLLPPSVALSLQPGQLSAELSLLRGAF